MNQKQFRPEKITKPIQLLAVWFSGLVILVSALLTAANSINEPPWLTSLMVISAIAIIPIFLFFIFLMQTKYRPQMQDDSFYSKYLDQTTNQILNISDENIVSDKELKMNQNIEFLKTHSNKLKELNSLLNTEENTVANKKLSERLSELIKETDSVIIKSGSTIDVQLNDLLPYHNFIYSALSNYSFINLSKFKSSQKEPPTKLLLSIGRNIEPKIVSIIIDMLLQMEPKIFITFIGESGFIAIKRKNQIVIGSYAYNSPERKVFEVNSNLRNKILNAKSKIQFQNLIK